MSELEECQITLRITELLLELRAANLPDSLARLARIERLAHALRDSDYADELTRETAIAIVFGQD